MICHYCNYHGMIREVKDHEAMIHKTEMLK